MCELGWLLRSDSAMPTGVFSPIKLATDGKVDGNEPISTFHWGFFLAVGQQLSKDGPWNTVFWHYICRRRLRKKLLTWNVLAKEAFCPLYSIPENLMKHCVTMQFCFIQHVENYCTPPHPRCTLSQHLVCKPACYAKKKLKSRNKVPAHASVLTRFTLLHNFNPLILKLSGFAPLYCICWSAFGCLIKGTGRESSAVTFIADLLKACF